MQVALLSVHDVVAVRFKRTFSIDGSIICRTLVIERDDGAEICVDLYGDTADVENLPSHHAYTHHKIKKAGKS